MRRFDLCVTFGLFASGGGSAGFDRLPRGGAAANEAIGAEPMRCLNLHRDSAFGALSVTDRRCGKGNHSAVAVGRIGPPRHRFLCAARIDFGARTGLPTGIRIVVKYIRNIGVHNC